MGKKLFRIIRDLVKWRNTNNEEVLNCTREAIHQLTYHLYILCERKKWADEARAYNELIGSWHSIVTASHEAGRTVERTGLDF